jgi:hypothetical protein
VKYDKDAFELGWVACEDGDEDNPYPTGSGDAKDWESGYAWAVHEGDHVNGGGFNAWADALTKELAL